MVRISGGALEAARVVIAMDRPGREQSAAGRAARPVRLADLPAIVAETAIVLNSNTEPNEKYYKDYSCAQLPCLALILSSMSSGHQCSAAPPTFLRPHLSFPNARMSFILHTLTASPPPAAKASASAIIAAATVETFTLLITFMPTRSTHRAKSPRSRNPGRIIVTCLKPCSFAASSAKPWRYDIEDG